MENGIGVAVLHEKCENCEREFEDGEEYWWVEVTEENMSNEHMMLCDDCYKALLEMKGVPDIVDPGDNGD